MLGFFLVIFPIYGAMERDIFAALIGPAFVLFYLFMSYLISGHWLQLFRRTSVRQQRNDE